eukprot:TRINITY_DN346_c0_g1_i1.p1 TRINITY_DN346_c0_g1~~TRINITY_DN346_c0_g1_i1.p1  ORF type:complete len:154 (+),score=66.41 TRINITY_DN346_c0_g1_i1:78-539(+)
MHPAIYKIKAHMRPGEVKFHWKRSYYFNTVWRKFKHSYFGMDTLPHIFYFTLPWVYASYQIFGNLFNHPQLSSSWIVVEPFRSTIFDMQGKNRHDFYQEGNSYRMYDHAVLAFGLKGKHRTSLEQGLDVNCPTSPMYGRRVLKAQEIVPYEAE